jgi:hypothetical protein
MKYPETAQEWQLAVDICELFLRIDYALQKYHLSPGGPTVNVECCNRMLLKGKEQGVEPDQKTVNRYLALLSQP